MILYADKSLDPSFTLLTVEQREENLLHNAPRAWHDILQIAVFVRPQGHNPKMLHSQWYKKQN